MPKPIGLGSRVKVDAEGRRRVPCEIEGFTAGRGGRGRVPTPLHLEAITHTTSMAVTRYVYDGDGVLVQKVSAGAADTFL